jgi:hypothetical protein
MRNPSFRQKLTILNAVNNEYLAQMVESDTHFSIISPFVISQICRTSTFILCFLT